MGTSTAAEAAFAVTVGSHQCSLALVAAQWESYILSASQCRILSVIQLGGCDQLLTPLDPDSRTATMANASHAL
ncbi:hypothetical protein C2E23DRAFT_833563 [Lenzites betulinus]|nr:hypothetical protein C2E23DRAFT_833563 [Lenzites betulinus]